MIYYVSKYGEKREKKNYDWKQFNGRLERWSENICNAAGSSYLNNVTSSRRRGFLRLQWQFTYSIIIEMNVWVKCHLEWKILTKSCCSCNKLSHFSTKFLSCHILTTTVTHCTIWSLSLHTPPEVTKHDMWFLLHSRIRRSFS
jgi:hypothetical protein